MNIISHKSSLILFIAIGFSACHREKDSCQCKTGHIGHFDQGISVKNDNDNHVYYITNPNHPYETYYDTLGGIYPYAGMPVKYCIEVLDTPYILLTGPGVTPHEFPQATLCGDIKPNN